MLSSAEFTQAFRTRYGGTPRLYRAPGRVNLIGEHTDYNAGLVMPAAIQFETQVAIAPRNDRVLRLHSINLNADHQLSLPVDFLNAGVPPRTGAWHDYVVGVAWTLGLSGLPIRGADLLIQGSVPLGSGLSSSASLEVAVAQALLSVSGRNLAPLQIATLCQRAENEFVGARCGLMDQFASVFGKAGRALYFDCRSLEHAPISLGGAALVVCNSMVHHQLASGEYNRRREQCESGVRALAARRVGIRTLRDVEMPELLSSAGSLDPIIFRRCRHVLSENARVAAVRDALSDGRLRDAGELMQASHASLRDDYEVSCEELDLLVGLAMKVDGVHGARMTGGGFGGCTVNLVRHDAVDAMMDYVSMHYERSTGRRPDLYRCVAADGAGAMT